MTYATVMVHLDVGVPNDTVLHVAGALARRFGARLIGIAAAQPMPVVFADGYVAGDLVQQAGDEIAAEVAAAERDFRATFQAGDLPIEWRAQVEMIPLADWFAAQARCADVIVTAVGQRESLFDNTRHLDLGDLVTSAGRPVLVVPAAVTALAPERILVAWQDTREARHAAAAALPLLKRAAHVCLVEVAAAPDIDAARDHLADVAAWLARHGVNAEILPELADGDASAQLAAIATAQAADVIVAGAFGHSRLREWALGGVTGDLLLQGGRCTLLSH